MFKNKIEIHHKEEHHDESHNDDEHEEKEHSEHLHACCHHDLKEQKFNWKHPLIQGLFHHMHCIRLLYLLKIFFLKDFGNG